MSESFDKAVEAGLLAFLTAENIHVIPGVDRQQAESAARREIETRDLKRMRATLRAALRATLPHLTAQDVPHSIRQAKAEAWDEGRRSSETAWGHVYSGHPALDGEMCPECCQSNPYAEEADHE